MDKPHIFLGSSKQQEKLLQAITRGIEDVARVDPWMTSFNPGTTTLERLVELAHEVDFAAFVFAKDDWTAVSVPASSFAGVRSGFPARQCRSSKRASSVESSECAGPSSSMQAARNFRPICSVSRAYGSGDDPSEMKVLNEKLRKAIEKRRAPCPHRRPVVAILPDGAQPRGAFRREPPPDCAQPRRRAGAQWPVVAGRWPVVRDIPERSSAGKEGAFGSLLLLERRTAAAPERAKVGRDGGDPAGVRRARGWVLEDSCYTDPSVNARTVGVYLRADAEDMRILDGLDNRRRAKLIADRLKHWKAITTD